MDLKRTLIGVLALTTVTFGGYFLFRVNQGLLHYADREYAQMQQEQRETTERPPSQRQEDDGFAYRWQKRDWWEFTGVLPDCPEPLNLQSPVDLSLVTAVLYPGQYRGGMEKENYKPHGGFRFDGLDVDEVGVYLPAEADVVEMSRYLVEGELQHTVDFLMPCGIVIRLGHLRKLSPDLAAIAETLPEPIEADSRTYLVEPLRMQQGALVATEVGLTGLGASPGRDNTFMDFGVYGTEQRNEASRNPDWSREHGSAIEQYALCWIDLLSSEDRATVYGLPPGPEGSVSDFCKKPGNLAKY